MKPIRHRSPKTDNTYTANFFQSPKKRQANIININNNNNNNLNNNFLNFTYNRNNYNYYDEITKAFNFITFILKQKDSQIQELKKKVKYLEKQLNEINETNMMTFNKKEINTSSNTLNLKFLKNDKNEINTFQNSSGLFSPYSNQRKTKSPLNNYLNMHTELSNNSNNTSNSSNIINIYKNNYGYEINKNHINKKILLDNNISIIHKMKNSANINKINNNRKIDELGKNNNYANFNSKNLNDINFSPMSINTNEHSSDKKNINKIRKESYHSNQNININMRNKNESTKQIKISAQKNFTTESENIFDQYKVKILNLNILDKTGSKSNSFDLSDDGNTIISKKDVKNYLKEVKKKLEPDRFKKFITQIKTLTKNISIEQKNSIILNIKNLLLDQNLINKFENIMKVNKNK